MIFSMLEVSKEEATRIAAARQKLSAEAQVKDGVKKGLMGGLFGNKK